MAASKRTTPAVGIEKHHDARDDLMVTSVNLSLSSGCGADCVYCPDDRGARIAYKYMPIEIARKIVDEVTDPAFIAGYKTKSIQIGENGDCFLNKQTIEILRYIKARKPDMPVFAWTNMQFFTPDKMEAVLRENLLDFIGVNIDGATEESFAAVKRIGFKYVQEGLPRFIELREKYGATIPLHVQSLTMRHYVDAVRTQLGRDPVRVSDPALLGLVDDFEQIRAFVAPLLKPQDRFMRSSTMFWAERSTVVPASLDYKAYSCPLLARVCNEAFIAPDGSWYGCCFDSNTQLVLGNVYETSVAAVARGEPRKRLVKLLTDKRFGDIGGPCATVNCCQLGINAPLPDTAPATREPAGEADTPRAIVTLAEAVAVLRSAHAAVMAGDRDAANEAVRNMVPLFPNDVTVLHTAGLCLRDAGAYDEALAMWERVFAILPRFHYTEIEVGVLHALRGDAEAARAWFARAIETEPGHIPAYTIAAAQERRAGAHHEALKLLERAHELAPERTDILAQLAEEMLWHGRRADAMPLLEAAAASGQASDAVVIRYLSLCAETGQYDRLLAWDAATPPAAPGSPMRFHRLLLSGQARLAKSFDRQAVIAEAAARETSARWLDGAAVHAMLREAIARQRPLSLVRFGDGEARFLAATDPWLSRVISAEEVATIGDSIWSNWFGQRLTEAPPLEVARVRMLLEASMEAADAIGLPLAERLSVDGYHFGYLAYLEQHAAVVLECHPTAVATDAFVNLELHRRSPFYRDLLAGLDFLGVVSPHPQLASRLGAALGIRDVVGHTVPGEMRLPHEARPQGHEPHFPHRFDALMAGLSVPHRGAVFLVAAGMLGKIYCMRIRELGGIALDVGSVVDAWMGFNTRPGQYDRAEDWVLPA